MKNILLVSVFMLLSVFSSDLKAQACCPDSSYSVQTIYTVEPNSGCTMEIIFCYKQLIGGDRSVKLCEINFNVVGCNPHLIVFDAEFWSFVDNKIFERADFLYPIGPCPPSGLQTNVIVEITKAKCLKVVNDPEEQTSSIIACGSGTGDCIVHYSVCKRTGGYDKVIVYGPVMTGIDLCPDDGPFNISTEGCFSSCY